MYPRRAPARTPLAQSTFLPAGLDTIVASVEAATSPPGSVSLSPATGAAVAASMAAQQYHPPQEPTAYPIESYSPPMAQQQGMTRKPSAGSVSVWSTIASRRGGNGTGRFGGMFSPVRGGDVISEAEVAGDDGAKAEEIGTCVYEGWIWRRTSKLMWKHQYARAISLHQHPGTLVFRDHPNQAPTRYTSLAHCTAVRQREGRDTASERGYEFSLTMGKSEMLLAADSPGASASWTRYLKVLCPMFAGEAMVTLQRDLDATTEMLTAAASERDTLAARCMILEDTANSTEAKLRDAVADASAARREGRAVDEAARRAVEAVSRDLCARISSLAPAPEMVEAAAGRAAHGDGEMSRALLVDAHTDLSARHDRALEHIDTTRAHLDDRIAAAAVDVVEALGTQVGDIVRSVATRDEPVAARAAKDAAGMVAARVEDVIRRDVTGKIRDAIDHARISMIDTVHERAGVHDANLERAVASVTAAMQKEMASISAVVRESAQDTAAAAAAAADTAAAVAASAQADDRSTSDLMGAISAHVADIPRHVTSALLPDMVDIVQTATSDAADGTVSAVSANTERVAQDSVARIVAVAEQHQIAILGALAGIAPVVTAEHAQSTATLAKSIASELEASTASTAQHVQETVSSAAAATSAQLEPMLALLTKIAADQAAAPASVVVAAPAIEAPTTSSGTLTRLDSATAQLSATLQQLLSNLDSKVTRTHDADHRLLLSIESRLDRLVQSAEVLKRNDGNLTDKANAALALLEEARAIESRQRRSASPSLGGAAPQTPSKSDASPSSLAVVTTADAKMDKMLAMLETLASQNSAPPTMRHVDSAVDTNGPDAADVSAKQRGVVLASEVEKLEERRAALLLTVDALESKSAGLQAQIDALAMQRDHLTTEVRSLSRASADVDAARRELETLKNDFTLFEATAVERVKGLVDRAADLEASAQ
ncbi:hypothetical protein BC828DRAFT_404433 [Blastocladiella britannica]|nr:hypothetical protein BC828DRAFT_404433 [Blastocladiella britannica]